MARTSSLIRRPPADLIAAPISAFESETQAVIQRATPYSEHAIMHVLVGMVVLVLLLMSVVKLDRVVTSTGKILPSRGSMFVQPLDRAIVTAILVHTGDVVKKGQPLATLDPTFAAADLKDLEQKQASSAALVARLGAERAGRPFSANPASPYETLQSSIWAERQTQYRQSINDFDARISNAREAIAKSRNDAAGYAQHLAYAKEAEQQQGALQEKGYGSRIRAIAAGDARVEAERMLSQSQSAGEQAQHEVAALSAQRSVFVSKWQDDINSQLVAAQNQLETAQQGLSKAAKVSNLSTLTAPDDAVVLSVGKASVGSMIDANSTNADPLFTLVPLRGALEAEVMVDAKDIGFIRPGDTVRVKLDAYKFTSHGVAKGVIKTISEGSFTDSQDGRSRAPFFKVRVVLTDVHLRNVPASFRLIPGMTLQGEILVGKRTIMSYVLEGALRTGSEAMREP